MKFLLDVQLPRSLATRLAEDGHPSRHCGDVGLATADDSEVLEAARQSQEVLLTHDLDFGRLLAFSGASAPSVLLFRGTRTDTETLFRRLRDTRDDWFTAIEEGALVVLEGKSVRIRTLPMSRE